MSHRNHHHTSRQTNHLGLDAKQERRDGSRKYHGRSDRVEAAGCEYQPQNHSRNRMKKDDFQHWCEYLRSKNDHHYSNRGPSSPTKKRIIEDERYRSSRERQGVDGPSRRSAYGTQQHKKSHSGTNGRRNEELDQRRSDGRHKSSNYHNSRDETIPRRSNQEDYVMDGSGWPYDQQQWDEDDRDFRRNHGAPPIDSNHHDHSRKDYFGHRALHPRDRYVEHSRHARPSPPPDLSRPQIGKGYFNVADRNQSKSESSMWSSSTSRRLSSEFGGSSGFYRYASDEDEEANVRNRVGEKNRNYSSRNEQDGMNKSYDEKSHSCPSKRGLEPYYQHHWNEGDSRRNRGDDCNDRTRKDYSHNRVLNPMERYEEHPPRHKPSHPSRAGYSHHDPYMEKGIFNKYDDRKEGKGESDISLLQHRSSSRYLSSENDASSGYYTCTSSVQEEEEEEAKVRSRMNEKHQTYKLENKNYAMNRSRKKSHPYHETEGQRVPSRGNFSKYNNAHYDSYEEDYTSRGKGRSTSTGSCNHMHPKQYKSKLHEKQGPKLSRSNNRHDDCNLHMHDGNYVDNSEEITEEDRASKERAQIEEYMKYIDQEYSSHSVQRKPLSWKGYNNNSLRTSLFSEISALTDPSSLYESHTTINPNGCLDKNTSGGDLKSKTSKRRKPRRVSFRGILPCFQDDAGDDIVEANTKQHHCNNDDNIEERGNELRGKMSTFENERRNSRASVFTKSTCLTGFTSGTNETEDTEDTEDDNESATSHTPSTKTSSVSVKTKDERDNIRQLLARRSPHLPDHDWKADWVQYMRNNHPLFGICCRYKENPIDLTLRVVMLFGSISFGLSVTNFTCLFFKEHGIVLPNGFTVNITSLILGSIIHPLVDFLIWNLSACSCCLPGGRFGNSGREFLVSTGRFFAITLCFLFAVCSALTSVFCVLKNKGGHISKASFWMFFFIELAISYTIVYPIVATLSFLGWVPCVRGRWEDMKRQEENQDQSEMEDEDTEAPLVLECEKDHGSRAAK